MSNQTIYTKDSLFRLINENVSKRIDESSKINEKTRKKKQVNGFYKVSVFGRVNFERPDGTLLLNKPHNEWFIMAGNFDNEGKCTVKTFDGKMYVIDENGEILDKHDNTTKTNINEGITKISGLALYESSKQKRAYKNKCYNEIQKKLGEVPNLDLNSVYEVVKDENGKPIFDDKGNKKVKTVKQHIEEKFRKDFFHVNIPEELRKIEYIFLKIALDNGFYSYKQNKDALKKLRTICRYLAGCFISHKPLPFSLDDINDTTTLTELGNIVLPHIPTGKENKQDMQSKLGRYEILKDIDFETAEKYGIYSNPESQLCYTENRDTWNEYIKGGENTAYLLLRDDWEKWNDGDKSIPPYSDEDIDESVPYDDYGLSMIFLFVDPDGEIATSNTRWNHEHSENIVVDEAFTKKDIEKLIGQKFEDVFVPEEHESIRSDEFWDIVNDLYNEIENTDFDNEDDYDIEDIIDSLKEKYNGWDGDIDRYRYHGNFEGFYCIYILGHVSIWNSNDRCFINDEWYDEIYSTYGDYFCIGKRNKYNLVHKDTGELMFDLPVDEWLKRISPYNLLSGLLPVETKYGNCYIDTNGKFYDFDEVLDICLEAFRKGEKSGLTQIGFPFDGFVQVRFFAKLNFINQKTGKLVWDKPYGEWFDNVFDYRGLGYKLRCVEINGVKYLFNVYEGRLISFDELADYLKTHMDCIIERLNKTDSNGNKMTILKYFGRINFILGDNGQFLFDLPFKEWPKNVRYYVQWNPDYFDVYFDDSKYNCILDFKGNIYNPDTFTVPYAPQNTNEDIIRISDLALHESSKQKKAYKNKCYDVIREYLGNVPNLNLDAVYSTDDKGNKETNIQHIEKKFRKEFFHVNIPEELRKIEYIFLKIALKSGFYSFNQDKGELNRLKTICLYLAGCFINNKPLPFSLSEIKETFTLDDLYNLVTPYISAGKENKQSGYTDKIGRYEILKDIDFDTAEEYGIYSHPESILCYTENQSTWDDYTNNGENTVFLLLRDDWEEWNDEDEEMSIPPQEPTEKTPYDDYGLSMIFLFVDPDGNLITSNTRWNHEHSEGIVVDKAFTKEDIEKLIGQDFDEVFVSREKEFGEKFRTYLANFEYYVYEGGMEVEEAVAELKDLDYDNFLGDEVECYKSNNIQDCYMIEICNKQNIWRSDKRCFISNIWFNYIGREFGDYILVQLRGRYNFIHKDTGELMYNLPFDEWFEYVNSYSNIGNFLIAKNKNGVVYIDENGKFYSEKEVADVQFGKYKNGDKCALPVYDPVSIYGFNIVKLIQKYNLINKDTGELVWNKPYDEWFDEINKPINAANLCVVEINGVKYFFEPHERLLISFDEINDYLKRHIEKLDKRTFTDSKGNKMVTTSFYGKYNIVIGNNERLLFDVPFKLWPNSLKYYSANIMDYVIVTPIDDSYEYIIDYKGNIYNPKTFNPEEIQKNSGN